MADISFYIEYFASAARAGVRSAEVLFAAIDPIMNVNVSTFDMYQNVYNVRNDLALNIRSAYEHIYTSAVSMEPMRDAFVYLSEYVRESTGMGVDDHLTASGIKAPRDYANIHRLATGETISTSNIEG